MTDLQQSLSQCRIEGNTVFLPAEFLKNYKDVRKSLMDAGATYKKNTFVFPNPAQPYIDRLMGGESVNIKKEFQFFETPLAVADVMVKLARLSPGLHILEPSAGQGAIIDAIERYRARTGHEIDSLDYCELMDINLGVLETKASSWKFDTNFVAADFLEYAEECGVTYDRIIANPPFSKGQDIEHISTMAEVCLDEKGVLVTIAGIGWMYGTQKKATLFRKWLDPDGHHSDESWHRFAQIGDNMQFQSGNSTVYIEMLDAGTFSESGTQVRACLIRIDRS